ncbi:hypothetical protein K402DRAFT_365595, partial [Aulographum hederae CBS 113979]
MASENTSWVEKELIQWKSAIYSVNDPEAKLHTSTNKGKEGLPYLTYIVDHYDNLPSIIAFAHSHRDGYPAAWHTDRPGYSNVLSLNSLNTNFVQQNGYANLRCNRTPGCPTELYLNRPRHEQPTVDEANFKAAWTELFPNEEPPLAVGVACCAQFAVSRDQVLKRPRGDYERFLSWLLETKLDDEASGRVTEYMWHMIFGQLPQYCPSLEQCRCDVYG